MITKTTTLQRTLTTFILFISASVASFSQTIVRVDPAGSKGSSPDLYRTGLFSNPRNAAGENVFYALNTPFNMLRDHTIEYKMLTSTSFSDCLAKVSSSMAYHLDKDQRTLKLNLLLAGTPSWMSSSTDTTTHEGVWKVRNTKPPANYALWDSLIRGIVTIVKGWGISPYYELWNEPDGGYWQGTQAELIKLYRHTAIAVKQADTNAKIGGFGMNWWYRGIGVGSLPPNFGYLPDSSVNQVSLLADLLDSSALWGPSVPLDFISYHFFSIYPNEIQRAEEFFNNKFASLSLPRAPTLITEWNTITSSRETPFHSPQVLRCYDKFLKGGTIEGQAVSVFQDWNYFSTQEFYQDYGVVSLGGLIKPALKSMILLDYLQDGSDTLNVTESSPIVSFASVKSDTVKVLLSNYVYYPFYAAIEVLLYDHPFNQIDLLNAGYTTSGQLDSTFRGLLPPQGSPAMVAAFNKATVAYAEHDANAVVKRNISLRLKGQTGLKNGRMFLIDSTHNNIIYEYDSMLAAGSTRAQAVAALYPTQTFDSYSVQITDSVFTFSMQPNATVLLEFYGVNTSTGIAESNATEELNVFPNPFKETISVSVPAHLDSDGSELILYDALGSKVKQQVKRKGMDAVVDCKDLAPGMYLIQLKNNETFYTHKIVKH